MEFAAAWAAFALLQLRSRPFESALPERMCNMWTGVCNTAQQLLLWCIAVGAVAGSHLVGLGEGLGAGLGLSCGAALGGGESGDGL